MLPSYAINTESSKVCIYLNDKVSTHQEAVSNEADDPETPCVQTISEHGGCGQPLRRIGIAAPSAGQGSCIGCSGASHPNQRRALVEDHQDGAKDAHGCAKNFDNPIFREDVDHLDAGQCVEFTSNSVDI